MIRKKIDKELWFRCVKEAGGMITIVTEKLNAAGVKIRRQTVAKYRDQLPWLKRAFEDEDWTTTDLAQKCIQMEVMTNWKAAAWWLERKAKDRGFGKELKVDSNEKPGTVHIYLPDDGRDKPDPSNEGEPVG